jgi:mannose-6-phosphate isomerase-like protein (cupin superfamily)
MKNIFIDNIEEITIKNNNYRKVLNTTKQSQLVVMSLKKGEDIGTEIHKDVTQFIRIEKGHGKAILDNKEYKLKDGSAIVIPAGTEHNVINTSKINSLKLYAIYSPPEHKPGTIQKNKPKEEHH